MKASKTIRIEWCFKWVSLRLKIAGAIVTEPVLRAQEFFDWGKVAGKVGSELSIDTTNARGRTKHSTFELQHEDREPLEQFRPQLTEYSCSVFTKTESPASLDRRKDARPPAVKFAPANRS